VRLAQITETGEDYHQASEILTRLVGLASAAPLGHVSILNALDLHLRGVSILVTGQGAESLFDAALRIPYIDRSARWLRPGEMLDENHPAKALAAPVGEPQALVCAGMRCSLPVADANALGAQVQEMLGSAGS
jgi:uncharacterized protein